MTDFTLADLGWSDFFARAAADLDPTLPPARVSAVHRDRIEVLFPDGSQSLVPVQRTSVYAVGDWVLRDGDIARHLLPAQTDLSRRAAGETVAKQRIAANMQTIAIVTSCNADFNPARLERYLALVLASGSLPLIVLTRADQVDDPKPFIRQAEQLSPLVSAIAVNAKDPEDAGRLAAWCKDGQTLALVGSSGVGKTTLRNALSAQQAATAAIREDDAKGRHTTTFRELLRTKAGGWLIDTPGMRELAITGADEGLSQLFDDLEILAEHCRFRDCAHETEPGCAVRAAVEAGTMDAERLARWQALRAEDARNSETLSETRAKAKRFGKVVKEAKRIKGRSGKPIR